MPTHTSSTKNLISELVAYTKKQLSPDRARLITKFIRLYYANVAAEDLQNYSLADLFAIALSHWHQLTTHTQDKAKIRVFNPEHSRDGWTSEHTVIQIAQRDRPFLVDSIQMEINRLGLSTHLILHTGGIKLKRNAKGDITEILPFHKQEDQFTIDAPIYIEVARQNKVKSLKDIETNLRRVLKDVKMAVEDWGEIYKSVQQCIDQLENNSSLKQDTDVEESIAFLSWLLHDHFTFLGIREYKRVTRNGQQVMELIKGSGLGVLTDDARSKSIRKYTDYPELAREQALSEEQVLIISKTNTPSTVHRNTYTDCIIIKQFSQDGKIVGEKRLIGLYSSTAYNTPPKTIPFLRQKIAAVLKKSGFPETSHAGKDLMHILSSLPRDDLFQAPADELYELAKGISQLQERRRIRLFVRQDAYGRYISCLVYIPRDNFNTEVLYRMQDLLMTAFNGIEADFTTHFSESILARIHFVIRIDRAIDLNYNLEAIENGLVKIGRSWSDSFRDNVIDNFGEVSGNDILKRYKKAFPAGYREVFKPQESIYDIQHIEKLSPTNTLEMSFYRPKDMPEQFIRFKLFHRETTVPLSDALPLLENMGLRVIGEQPYQININNEKTAWINDFMMTTPLMLKIDVKKIKHIFHEAFSKIWFNQTENDGLNRLVIAANIPWRDITVLRAYAKYLRQTNFSLSLNYVSETFFKHPDIANLIMDLFKLRFDPAAKEKEDALKGIEETIIAALENVSVLDEDRIIRRYIALIKATLRCNYYQTDKNGQHKPYLAFKFDPSQIPDLPLPLPKFEIFVYSPRVEGIHLRSDKVARGGLRWSDRKEDFRTEVLGLMKAQQVKNAVIVPAGAKGGFIVKAPLLNASRDAILEEGIRCYKDFIRGLLDLTDNLHNQQTIRPLNTVCYDDKDPYLVVAADKGTASFSDIANGLALERNYWLGDAFASGGSTGYDHKKMGITARGAWVSAQRHFQDLGVDLNKTEITVIGIGDMGGDVFGNGLLSSEKIKLIAAFNHLHLFFDPNPVTQKSYAERLRLFNLPRSSWQDYNPELISKGGGVFRRAAKFINVTPEMREWFAIKGERIEPNQLIAALLKAPVDMIWNGGIGTFVKASSESNEDTSDRSNDTIRVNANQLNAKTVVEGGNLGLTQLARIEYELHGGKINTDFIDNSAGVDCSDHEVNIKILLNSIANKQKMTEKQRNRLLVHMADEVANLVLQTNYRQNQALSLAALQSFPYIELYTRYLAAQEEAGNIDRNLEFLPNAKTFIDRKANNLGLTRPELAILFSYSKIILDEEIMDIDLIKDPDLFEFMMVAFPSPLHKYKEEMENHPLRKRIIATQIGNRLVSDLGITFVYQMYDETGAPTAAIIRSYVVATKIFRMHRIIDGIKSLDYTVDSQVQLNMQLEIMRLIRRATRWFLRNRRQGFGINQAIDNYSDKIEGLFKRLPKLLLGKDKEFYEQRKRHWMQYGVPEIIAAVTAGALPMYHTLNIIEAATQHHSELFRVAKIYFMLVDRLDLLWFRDQINEYPVDTRWSVLAKAAYKGDLDAIQQKLTVSVLDFDTHARSIPGRLNSWFKQHEHLIVRWQNVLEDMRRSASKDFAILSVAIRELNDLAQASLLATRRHTSAQTKNMEEKN